MGYGRSSDLQNNLLNLVNIVQQIQNFPWQQVADQVHMDRWRLYHNWNETIMRQVSGPISKEDQEMIKMHLRDTLLKNKESDLGKNFQTALKEHLSKEYHRSSFSIAFNNCKRQIQREIDQAVTPESKNKIRKEVQQFFENLEANKQTTENSEQVDKTGDKLQFPTVNQGQTYMEFLQEPSTTTAEFCKQLEMKINNKQYQQNGQTQILLDQLKQLQHKSDVIL